MQHFNPRNKKTILGLKAKTYATIVIILLVLINTLFITWFLQANLIRFVYAEKLVVPQEKVVVENPTSEQEQIIAFIKQVFGKDSHQALRIAKCESGIRANAVNDNTKWGGVSQDLGVFQINKHYQGVTNPNFLFDYKINVLMAHKIFTERGNWSAWTCSRTLGI